MWDRDRLGQVVASEILRAHDGEISVESDAAYTTFTVRMPLRRLGS